MVRAHTLLGVGEMGPTGGLWQGTLGQVPHQDVSAHGMEWECNCIAVIHACHSLSSLLHVCVNVCKLNAP